VNRLRISSAVLVLALIVTGCSGDDDDDDSSTPTTEAEDTTTTSVVTPEEALAMLQDAHDELETLLGSSADDVDAIRPAARTMLRVSRDALTVIQDEGDDRDAALLQIASVQLRAEQARLVLEAMLVEGEGSADRGEVLTLADEVGAIATVALSWAGYLDEPDTAEAPLPVPGDETPPLDRPTGPESAWRATVEEMKIPLSADVCATDPEQVFVFIDAASKLGDEPDPDIDDGHLRAAKLRLQWLIEASACSAAAVNGAGYPSIAQDLNAIKLGR
jgi:hypothetical protein